MPEAEGFIKSTSSGSRFTATFQIDGLNYLFSGPTGSSMQPWTCSNATVTYPKAKELTGTRDFEGRIGPKNVSFLTGNNVRITGVLDMPISPGSSVSGNGIWTQALQFEAVPHKGIDRA